MITHKLIQQETEELKQAFKKEEIVIPSFWKCCWPGLVYMILINCWYCISMKLNIDE